MRKGLLVVLLVFFTAFSAPSANAQWSFSKTNEQNYSGFYQYKNLADKKTCEIWILSGELKGEGLEIRAIEEGLDIKLLSGLTIRRIVEIIIVGKWRKVRGQHWLYVAAGNEVGHPFFTGPKTYETYCQKLTASLPPAVRKRLPKKMK